MARVSHEHPLPAGPTTERRSKAWRPGNTSQAGRGSRRRGCALFCELELWGSALRCVIRRSVVPMIPNRHEANHNGRGIYRAMSKSPKCHARQGYFGGVNVPRAQQSSMSMTTAPNASRLSTSSRLVHPFSIIASIVSGDTQPSMKRYPRSRESRFRLLRSVVVLGEAAAIGSQPQIRAILNARESANSPFGDLPPVY